LYCCGFPKSWSKAQLEELFQQTSTQIISSRILVDPQTNQSRGIGFIRFGSYEDALKAIAELNGKTVEGANQPLQVRFAKERNKTTTDATASIPAVTYDPATQQYYSYWPTGGLDGSVLGTTAPEGYQFAYAGTDGTLQTSTTIPPGYTYAYAGSSGLTSSLGYPSTLSTTGYPYSYAPYGTTGTGGLVAPPGYQFATIGASGELTGIPSTTGGPVSLFVLHIPSNFRDDDLNQLFQDYGTVATAKVMLDPSSGQSKGYGFVNMSTYMEAQAAIAGLNGYHVPNTNKYLKVSFKTAGPGAKKENPFD
jgi:RNA recognition motif-containing protein